MSRFHGGIKRDKLDAVFSDLIRERVDYICQRCQRDFRQNTRSLHCSHVFGRAKKSTRWHPDNALALCVGCHENMGQHPIDHAELVKSLIGSQKYDRLRYIASKPTKFTKSDKEYIYQHYKGEKKRLLALRSEGQQGRIEFTTL